MGINIPLKLINYGTPCGGTLAEKCRGIRRNFEAERVHYSRAFHLFTLFYVKPLNYEQGRNLDVPAPRQLTQSHLQLRESCKYKRPFDLGRVLI